MYVTGQTGTTEFVQQGPGLAFVAYPQALTKLPAAAIWSVLFFLMLLTLGLDSQAGFYYFELLDTYATAFSVVVIGFLETLVITYLYVGARTLLDDVEWMIGPLRKSTRYWWMLTWYVLVPVLTRHNRNDAIIIPIICGSTSIYGGFAIYSVIGHLMYVTGQTGTTEFVQQGPGLAFVAYPQALTKLPAAAIWSVLFFLMLLTLGLDSQVRSSNLHCALWSLIGILIWNP
ncbi:hypothetical protein AHF37_04099 [Paragonimus kellicotti]|nr:hypothetical protein AHF37_04099 [Paragonimus kellicotti]